MMFRPSPVVLPSALLVVAFASLSAACSDDPASDAGLSPDAGAPADSGPAGSGDAGAGIDAGETADAGAADSGPGGPIDVVLTFEVVVGASPFSCAQTYPGVGLGGASTWTPNDLRFYVSGITLDDGTGEVPMQLSSAPDDAPWQEGDVALLDFEDGSGDCGDGNALTRAIVRGTVPAGSYRGLTFTVGVPESLNHADGTIAMPPLNLSSMFWSWRDGYKFLKVDGTTAGRPGGLFIHVGSTGCVNDNGVTTCTSSNRAQVTLPDFDPATNVVVADLAVLIGGADLEQNAPNTAPGCMSEPADPDCVPIFRALGLPTATEPTPPAQAFFRMR